MCALLLRKAEQWTAAAHHERRHELKNEKALRFRRLGFSGFSEFRG